jgi:hypothetical protein
MKITGTSNDNIVNSVCRFFALLLIGIGCFAMILHGGFAWHWPVSVEAPDFNSTFINNLNNVA